MSLRPSVLRAAVSVKELLDQIKGYEDFACPTPAKMTYNCQGAYYMGCGYEKSLLATGAAR